jgi:RNA-directed DNA polymerase
MEPFSIACVINWAERALVMARAFLREKLGVELHPEKTRIVHVTDGFEFLGYKIKRGRLILNV